MYLEAAGVENLLVQLSRVAAPGSRLGADFINEDFLTSPSMQTWLQSLALRGMAGTFGVSESEALLARFGWRADVVQPGEEGATFSRWPYPFTPRAVPSLPRSLLLTTVKVAQ